MLLFLTSTYHVLLVLPFTSDACILHVQTCMMSSTVYRVIFARKKFRQLWRIAKLSIVNILNICSAQLANLCNFEIALRKLEIAN